MGDDFPVKVSKTEIPGVVLIEPRVFEDPRGSFCESWSEVRYSEAGIPARFVQDNISKSVRDTLRGLHLQHPNGQGKLVQALVGEVFDVAVDVRVGSPHFGQWTSAVLSEKNRNQLYIPPGFAHGFCVLSDIALFAYKSSAYYDPDREITVAWNDSQIGIRWPLAEPVLSKKDTAGQALEALGELLPRYGR